MYRASLGTRGESRRAAAEAETAVVGRVRRWERIVRPAALAPHVTIPQWVRGERPPSTPSPKRGPLSTPAPVAEIPPVPTANEVNAEMPDVAPPTENPPAPPNNGAEAATSILSTNPVVSSELEHVVENVTDLNPTVEVPAPATFTAQAEDMSEAENAPVGEVIPSADVAAVMDDTPATEDVALVEGEDVTPFVAPSGGADHIETVQSVDHAIVPVAEDPERTTLEGTAPMELDASAPMGAPFSSDIPVALSSSIPKLPTPAESIIPPIIPSVAPGTPTGSEDADPQ